MKTVRRWFMETTDGEMLDGPFKTKREANDARTEYIDTYHYIPTLIQRDMEASFLDAPIYDVFGLQTGHGKGGGKKSTKRMALEDMDPEVLEAL